jgi:antirestriction protein ArdC
MIDHKVQRLLDLSGAKVVSFVEGIMMSSNISMENAAKTGGLYNPALDSIAMNPFCVEPNSVMLHELGHWSGHSSRLSRQGIRWLETSDGHKLMKFSDMQTEEFVAQLTACKLLKKLELDNHIANALLYKMIGVYAKGDMAQADIWSSQACDYLINIYNRVEQKIA